MAGFLERTEAAARVFKQSIEESKSIATEAAKIAADPKVNVTQHINGALFVPTVLGMMVPLAVGDAVYAFIKPPQPPGIPA